MAKVTNKLQVTVPKAIADQYGIRPGDEVTWLATGDMIRLVPAAPQRTAEDELARRLELFDQATARQRRRARGRPKTTPGNRGWIR